MPASPTTYAKTEVDGKVVVGVADFAVTNNPSATLVTYALGSCIGVTIYDPAAKVAGILHFMLPDSRINAEKAQQSPAMFADTGIPRLFKSAYELGAKKQRLIVCAAGGAEVLDDDGHFKVGSRNRTMIRKIFWKNNILLAADETGGSISRTLWLKMADGSVIVRNQGKERVLWPQ
ncbi:MAG: chemotaxis protein CheD [Planctomycetes bacterium]|nr:chemotaxis protein CheD [Planctomycetota bacterium]